MKKLLVALIAMFSIGVTSMIAGSASAPYYITSYEVEDSNSYEIIYGKSISDENYDGITYSSTIVLGIPVIYTPQVKIGNSIGHFIASGDVIQDGYIIGKKFIYKHYGVTNGYYTATYSNLYDSHAYVR